MAEPKYYPEVPTVAIGETSRNSSILAVPYYIDDDRLVISASLLLDAVHERPTYDTENLYIALGDTALKQNTEIIFGGGLCRLELHRRELYVAGNHVPLSPSEYTLLSIHGRNLDKVIPDEYPDELIWGRHHISTNQRSGTVSRRIFDIRSRLDAVVPGLGDKDTGAFRIIKGVGNMLCSDFLGIDSTSDPQYKSGIRIKPVNTSGSTKNVAHAASESPSTPLDTKLPFAGGEAVLNVITGEIVSDETIRLNKSEMKFMSLLASNLGQFMSFKKLAHELLPPGDDDTNFQRQLWRFAHLIASSRKKLNMAKPGLGHPDTGALARVGKRGCILLDELGTD